MASGSTRISTNSAIVSVFRDDRLKEIWKIIQISSYNCYYEMRLTRRRRRRAWNVRTQKFETREPSRRQWNWNSSETKSDQYSVVILISDRRGVSKR